MAQKQVIAVVGATGMQGSGLVRAILADRESGMTVRALTRDVHSDKAKELSRLGAEVVAADVHDVGSLKRAFAGTYGAFCVTFFWAHMSPEKGYAEAEAMATAAKATGVQHVIWSTLEDTRRWVPLTDNRMPTVMGKYKVPHFDVKGEADQLFKQLGLPTTYLLTSFYWDNLIYFGMGPKKGTDGTLLFTLPMGEAKLPGIAAEDIGKCALALFKKRESYLGKTVGVAGGHLTGSEMAAALAKALGQEVLTRYPRKSIGRWGSPAPMIWATCFNLSAISRWRSAVPGIPRSPEPSIPACKHSRSGWTSISREFRCLS